MIRLAFLNLLIVFGAYMVIFNVHVALIQLTNCQQCASPPDHPPVDEFASKYRASAPNATSVVSSHQQVAPQRLDEFTERARMQVADRSIPPKTRIDFDSWDTNALATPFDGTTTTARSQRVLYMITPTYERDSQMVDLVRLSQTLQLAAITRHVRIYWIIIEDREQCSQRVRDILDESGLYYAHDAVKTPKKSRHRGIAQRNRALDIIEKHVKAEGVIYFCDDDNAYNVQLFTELPYTKKVSVFGAAFAAKHIYERCHVDPDTGRVAELLSYWPERAFPMDMAGFAFSTATLVEKGARFSDRMKRMHLETEFLSKLAHNVTELEPLAANCTRILAWHVKTDVGSKNRIPHEDEETYNLLKQFV